MSLIPTKKTEPSITLKDKLFFIYGVQKIGKTTFASTFPNALIAAAEPGYKELSIYKTDIDSWDTFRQFCAELIKGKGKTHEYETLIIDTVDILWDLCCDYVLKKEKVTHEQDLPWGKAYTLQKREFKKVITAVAVCGFGIVFLSHVKEKEVETKRKKITRVDSTLPDAPKLFISGLCDFIFYLCADGDSDERFIFTKGTESLNAGDRSGVLPEKIPLTSYSELERIYKEEKLKRKG